MAAFVRLNLNFHVRVAYSSYVKITHLIWILTFSRLYAILHFRLIMWLLIIIKSPTRATNYKIYVFAVCQIQQKIGLTNISFELCRYVQKFDEMVLQSLWLEMYFCCSFNWMPQVVIRKKVSRFIAVHYKKSVKIHYSHSRPYICFPLCTWREPWNKAMYLLFACFT